jgi:hypothetical protein
VIKRDPQEIAGPLFAREDGAVEMQENGANRQDSIESIVENLLEITSRYSCANDTSLAREPMEIYASAQEGARLMRVFIRIKQPDARAAIIKLATQMAEVRASTKPVES